MGSDYTLNKTPEFVNLDADQQGHIAVVLADYHSKLNGRLHDALGCEDYREINELFYTVYLLGNMQGRALHNRLTQTDLDLFVLWEAELEEDSVLEQAEELFEEMQALWIADENHL